jgi:hypothetical protein
MNEYVSVTNLLLAAIFVLLLIASFKGWGWA